MNNILITNNHGNNFLSELINSFERCHKFQLSVAFINYSGLQLLLDTLKELEEKGVPGEVITSTYLNFTDPKALKKLREFKNIELKIYPTDTNLKVGHLGSRPSKMTS